MYDLSEKGLMYGPQRWWRLIIIIVQDRGGRSGDELLARSNFLALARTFEPR